MKVIHAHVRRIVHREGQRCCEVETHTDSEEYPELLVCFGSSRDNDFDMTAVVKNDAATEIDWYDNNIHSAFTDVTIGLFETSTMKTNWGKREDFKEQVLSFPGVRAEIGALLNE